MCNTKPCDNCCHEEDLICCMPMMHCCGGYSEHNNCCPHNRCCNHPCCCDDGCPFTPECCCCKAMKCCKENKEKIESVESTISTIESTIIRDELKHDSDISNINHTIEDISNVIQLIIEDAITNISYNNTTKYITYKTKNGSPVNVIKVAPLDNANKIPSEYLPSYVDDVIEGYYYNNDNKFYYDQNHTNPITGEDGKIYVDITEGRNNTYRYTGSTYIEVSPTKFGKTAGTAYEGNNGAALESALATHTSNTTIHITTAERTAWNAKPDRILIGQNGIIYTALLGIILIPKYPSTLDDIVDGSTRKLSDYVLKNEIGTAAYKDVPVTGNASTTQVVMGNDSRLTDARTPVSHTHTKSEITDFPTNVSSFTNDAGYITSSDIPVIPTVGTLNTNNATAQTTSSSESFSNSINLHKISKTGDWGDLLNKPSYTLDDVADGTTRKLSDYVKKTEAIGGVSINGNVLTFTSVSGSTIATITLPTYPCLWEVDSNDNTKIVAKDGKAAMAAGFYDTTVS